MAESGEEAPDPRLTSKRSRKRAAAVVVPDPAQEEAEEAEEAAWFSAVASVGREGPARPTVAAAGDLDGAALAERIVSRLNPEQARAVTTTDGPAARSWPAPDRARRACWRTASRT